MKLQSTTQIQSSHRQRLRLKKVIGNFLEVLASNLK